MKLLSIEDQKKLLNRTIILINENLEIRKDNEFKDFRIRKLEQQIGDLMNLLSKSSKVKIQYERIQLYV